MTEAKLIHQELVRALHELIPRTVYRDSRRLDTLAWAITGITLRESVHLSAWAEVTQSRAQRLASRIQRFSAFLHNGAISPPDWYQPVLRAALSAWPAAQRVSVALDTSVLTPFVLIPTALVYRGRAIPLTWRVLRHRSAKVSFAAYQPLLDQLATLFPTEQPLTLLADRGFAQEALLEYARAHHYHVRLRLAGRTLIHLRGSGIVPLKTLYPPAGHARFLQQVHLFGSAFGPLSLTLATPLEAPDDRLQGGKLRASRCHYAHRLSSPV